MTSEDAIALVEQYLERGRLTKVQEIVFRQSWEGKTYSEIAQNCQYDPGHLKDVGSDLWRSLSGALGEKVTKQNLNGVLQRYSTHKFQAPDLDRTVHPIQTAHIATSWDEAPDVSIFHGRVQEMERVHRWCLFDQCRVIALLGMGGIGKTTFSVKLAQRLQPSFQIVIWRSLRDAPPLSELLQDLIQVLSGQSLISASSTVGRQISTLTEHLRTTRCLLVLDNFDALLECGQRAGCYRADYEAYGQLLQRVGEVAHQSCLLITSREKPAEIAAQEGEKLPVRSLFLPGLDAIAGQQLLSTKGLSSQPSQIEKLVDCYHGNPLSLKIAATSILDLFEGDVSEFLEQNTTVFNGIRNLLSCQIQKLSSLEQQVMYWLAINREPHSLAQLHSDITPTPPKSELLETLESLCWRALVEKSSHSNQPTTFTQQPVVMEYMTQQLVQQASQELIAGKPHLLDLYPLIKAQAKDYIREQQTRVILSLVATELEKRFSDRDQLEQHFKQMITTLRTDSHSTPGYAGGNIINLLRYLKFDLAHYDFSRLSLWQSYLQGIKLHGVNLSDADLSKSTFNTALTNIVWIEFSPDGSQLATCDANGMIRLWSVDGQERLSFVAHPSWAWAVRFSPDGKQLASCSGDYTVKLWDVETGQCIHCFEAHSMSVLGISFSPDGRWLASSGFEQVVRIWDLKSRSCLTEIPGVSGRAIAVSPDGNYLACLSQNQSAIVLWDVHQQAIAAELLGHTKPIWSIHFSPDSQCLASGGEDGVVRLWNLSTQNCQQILSQASMQWIWSLAFSPSGDRLLIADDSSIRQWDVNRNQWLRSLHGHSGHLWSLAWSPDQQRFASSAEDQTIRFWQASSGRCIKTLQGYNNRIRAIALSPNGTLLAAAVNQEIHLWETATGTCTRILSGEAGEIYTIAFDRSETRLVSGDNKGTIKIWQLSTGQCLQTLKAHSGRIFAVTFDLSNQWLMSAGADQQIRVWETQTFQSVQTLAGHSGWVFSIALSRDGQTLVSGSDSEMKLWNVRTGDCLRTLRGHEGWVWSVAFSANDRKVISGGFDQTVKCWNVETGECEQTLAGHTKAVMDAIPYDSDRIMSCSRDRTIKLWNTKTGACLHTFEGHSAWVWKLALHPEQRLLISGSQDETIRLWNLETKRCSEIWQTPRPYEGTNISGVRGLSDPQKLALKILGAAE